MKKLLMGIVAGAVVCAGALAQDTPPASQDQTGPPAAASQPQSATKAAPGDPAHAASATNTPGIAPGSVIPVQLTKTVDAKKAKSGDQVVAMVTQDMRTQSGEVLVPKDTKVIGHVTEAQARNKEQKESQLAIAFDQAVLKGGQVQMPMSIQAVVAPPSNNDNQGGAVSGTPSPGSPAGGSTSPMAGRSPTGGGAQQQQQQPQADDTGSPQGSKRPPINAQTQGVIGISNVTLAAGSSPAQGSVLTSDKNNVKLESGTMLLLKVQ
jgi:hypothetical protein